MNNVERNSTHFTKVVRRGLESAYEQIPIADVFHLKRLNSISRLAFTRFTHQSFTIFSYYSKNEAL